MGKHAHPAGSGIDAVDDAAVGLAAPVLDIDAHGRRLKDLDRPQRRRRRIPKRHMEPVPQPVLIGRNKRTEAEQWGSLMILRSDAAACACASRTSGAVASPWGRGLFPRVPDGCLRKLCSALRLPSEEPPSGQIIDAVRLAFERIVAVWITPCNPQNERRTEIRETHERSPAFELANVHQLVLM